MQQSQQQLEYSLQEEKQLNERLIKKVTMYLSAKDNYIKERTKQNLIILSNTEKQLKAMIAPKKEDSSFIQYLSK